jgi:uncharacterized protein YegL
MSGPNWSDVLKATSETLKKIKDSKFLFENIKISIFSYSGNSIKICEELEADENIISKIKYIGGGTNFEYPLNDAYLIIEKSIKRYDRFFVAFMSDGIGYKPDSAIKKFLSNENLKILTKFFFIHFGTSKGNLKEIAESLGDKLRLATDIIQLNERFLEILNECKY